MKIVFILTSVLLGSSFGIADQRPSESVSSVQFFKRVTGREPPIGEICIIIDNMDYEMGVFGEQGWYANYLVEFGNNSLDDKKMEGDKKTAEGTFRIVSNRVHEKWYRFLAIDYP